MSKELEPHEDEGTRAFGVLLSQVDDGCFHAEASETLQALTRELAAYAGKYMRDAKGDLTLKLSLKVSPQGTVTLTGDVKKKAPPTPRGATTFWVTKGGNLANENPRQQKLPLRDVSAPEKPRDIEPTKQETRI